MFIIALYGRIGLPLLVYMSFRLKSTSVYFEIKFQYSVLVWKVACVLLEIAVFHSAVLSLRV